MALELKKLSQGEKVNLTKDNPGLNKIRIGLSWDVKEGLEADLDASVILLNSNDKMIGEDGIVFYNRLKSNDGAIEHKGDNRTGAGDGDDETITIELNKISSNISALLFAITSYSENAPVTFGRVKNASVRLYDDSKNSVLYSYDLTEDMSTATSMEMAKVYRAGNEWKFAAVGEKRGSSKNGLEDVINKYK